MAQINSRTLFLTTSPRTPDKMIPEIALLVDNFAGKKWDKATQADYMRCLAEADYYHGSGANDPAFSARDRITRSPKALGLVALKPVIGLTPAGRAFIEGGRSGEVLLRQMMKFQLPSPFHTLGKYAARFCVKPYLELLRLVRTLGTLKFDELQIFGMQLVDWHDFDHIVDKINRFRADKAVNRGIYKRFKAEVLHRELHSIYADRIADGRIKTRESAETSLDNFLRTQMSNLRDYADAAFRYLRATGLVNVSYVGKSLSIVPERMAEVDYLLDTIDRNPAIFDNESRYIEYLGDVSEPILYTDNREALIERMYNNFPEETIEREITVESLKERFEELTADRKQRIMEMQLHDLKQYRQYDDIQQVYDRIGSKDIYDAPLMLEWNTWRAMTMLDGGEIRANLKFDDFGAPLSTARGNVADIECRYDGFMVTVEVTMMAGQRQFEAERESVLRHLGRLNVASGQPCYCLFVAPEINQSAVAYFYVSHRVNVSYYGGVSKVIPLPLEIFRKMLADSYSAGYVPTDGHLLRFLEAATVMAHVPTK